MSVSKGDKVQAKGPTASLEVSFASVAPTTKKAKKDQPEEGFGCFWMFLFQNGPLLQGTTIFGFSTFGLSTDAYPSFTANTVEELVSKLPSHISGPILVDTIESQENWDVMNSDSKLGCCVVWHGGKLFIVELQTHGHETAIYQFIISCEAMTSQLPHTQLLEGTLTSSIILHHPPPAQPAKTTIRPDCQWRLNEAPVLVVEVGWTQTWTQLLAKANQYLTLTNDVKLVVLVKFFPNQGQPVYTPGTPQPAAVGPVTLPMQAAVASILQGQFFLSQVIYFGVGQANDAQPRLRLPFRRLYPQEGQAAVDIALGNNPHIDLTQMRTKTERAFLSMVRNGDLSGTR